MSLQEFQQQLDTWGQSNVPFFFMIDFEMEKPVAIPLTRVDPKQIRFEVNGFKNYDGVEMPPHTPLNIVRHPLSFEDYKEKFDYVYRRLCYGDSYLTNLTVKTRVELPASLEEIFHRSRARYKLLYQNEFLVFSPEIFVRIENGMIYSYPMKGTIDASVPNAREKLRDSKKEQAEHTTIVDLIRNDLSCVAEEVHVARFRYVEELKTSNKNLLQVSSEIVGKLPSASGLPLGTILLSLLPAGSISGAPKMKTLEIIRNAEGEKRGYYTGVFGYFDGQRLDSGVMIRYIEYRDGKFFYRSGGGITTGSVVEDEYNEMIDKVYVPFD